MYITGQFQGSANFGSSSFTSNGGRDIFVARVASTGVISWAIQLGGTLDDMGRGICSDGAGGTFVVGTFKGSVTFPVSGTLTSAGSHDGFVMRVDSAGNVLWAVQVGGSSHEYAMECDEDGSNGALVIGQFQSASASFGAAGSLSTTGSADMFVFKVSSSGTIGWATKGGGTDFDSANGVARDGSGGSCEGSSSRSNSSSNSSSRSSDSST